jgi:predicted nucleic acid-binding Zn ribbon protein
MLSQPGTHRHHISHPQSSAHRAEGDEADGRLPEGKLPHDHDPISLDLVPHRHGNRAGVAVNLDQNFRHEVCGLAVGRRSQTRRLQSDLRILGGVQHCSAEHVVARALPRGLRNIGREIGAGLGRAQRRIVHRELPDGDAKIKARPQAIARQINRSGEAAARDDVVVAQGRQRTRPIHEHDERRLARNDLEGTAEVR